jgi:molybdenum cofactor cytidylyltransferase
VIPSFHYKGGHPIKLSKIVKQKILETDPESNLRVVLNCFNKKYISVDDPGVIMDIDTEENYQQVIDYYNKM